MRVSGRSLLVLTCLLLGCEVNPASPRFTALDPFTFESGVTTQVSFRLEDLNGDVTVTGSASASTVTATGFRRVTAASQEEADDRLPDIRVAMTATSDEILLEADHPGSGPGWTYAVDVSIVVPQGMAVTILNGNGSVDLDGAAGGVVITTGNGTVTTRNVLGDMRLTVGNGGISSQATLLAGSAVRVDAGNGNIQLRIPRSTSALVDAAVGNGLITVSGLPLSQKIQDETTLSGRLGTGNGSIVLRSGNGNIALVGT